MEGAGATDVIAGGVIIAVGAATAAAWALPRPRWLGSSASCVSSPDCPGVFASLPDGPAWIPTVTAARVAALCFAFASAISRLTWLTCSGDMRLMDSTVSPFAAVGVGEMRAPSPKISLTISCTTTAAFLPSYASSDDTASAKACWSMGLAKVMRSLDFPAGPAMSWTDGTRCWSTYSRISDGNLVRTACQRSLTLRASCGSGMAGAAAPSVCGT